MTPSNTSWKKARAPRTWMWTPPTTMTRTTRRMQQQTKTECRCVQASACTELGVVVPLPATLVPLRPAHPAPRAPPVPHVPSFRARPLRLPAPPLTRTPALQWTTTPPEQAEGVLHHPPPTMMTTTLDTVDHTVLPPPPLPPLVRVPRVVLALVTAPHRRVWSEDLGRDCDVDLPRQPQRTTLGRGQVVEMRRRVTQRVLAALAHDTTAAPRGPCDTGSKGTGRRTTVGTAAGARRGTGVEAGVAVAAAGVAVGMVVAEESTRSTRSNTRRGSDGTSRWTQVRMVVKGNASISRTSDAAATTTTMTSRSTTARRSTRSGTRRSGRSPRRGSERSPRRERRGNAAMPNRWATGTAKAPAARAWRCLSRVTTPPRGIQRS